jgi:hypothetical protein
MCYMNQADVYEWFKNKRESGREDFFSIRQVYKELRLQNCQNNFVSIWNHISKLKSSGFLEIEDVYPAGYRYKSIVKTIQV